MPADSSDVLLQSAFDLQALMQDYDSPDYLGAMLVGSATGHASGKQIDQFSDIDLIFLANEIKPDSYRLSFWQERLVSTTITSVTETMESFSDPLKAIQNIEGLRRAVILRDTASGALGKIQAAALQFDWSERLICRAEQQASYQLAGNAEEVHKILGALRKEDITNDLQGQGRLLAGLMGLTLAMPLVIALKYRILSQSENLFLSQIHDTIGSSSNWFSIYKRCLEGQLTARAMAALELYEATSVICLPFANHGESQELKAGQDKIDQTKVEQDKLEKDKLEQEKLVIRKTLKRIESCLNRKL